MCRSIQGLCCWLIKSRENAAPDYGRGWSKRVGNSTTLSFLVSHFPLPSYLLPLRRLPPIIRRQRRDAKNVLVYFPSVIGQQLSHPLSVPCSILTMRLPRSCLFKLFSQPLNPVGHWMITHFSHPLSRFNIPDAFENRANAGIFLKHLLRNGNPRDTDSRQLLQPPKTEASELAKSRECNTCCVG